MSTLTILTLLVLNVAPEATAAEVSAARLDGTTVSGDLHGWDSEAVEITTADGQQRIGADQLVSLRWSSRPQTEAQPANNSGLAELVDGSLIPIDSVRVAGRLATLTLNRSAASRDNTLSMPATRLAAVRFQSLDKTLAAQWDEIRHLNLPTDLLAVLKRDGKSLDYVEGVMGDVSAQKIDFKIEGESLRVDRTKVAGVVYHRTDRASTTEACIVVHGRSGLRANASSAELNGSQLALTTAAGVKLTWPIDEIYLADFSAGKLMYLSDMEPASERWTPLVGLPSGVTLAAEYGQPRRDESAYGGPLTLITNDAERTAVVRGSPDPVQIPASTAGAGDPRITFNKGLALRSRTEIVYRVPAGFRRFVALAGIDPATSASGTVRLSIVGDDQTLLETDIAGDQPPRPIDLEIADVKRLKIVVDFGQNLDTGDWLNLCDARIVK